MSAIHRRLLAQIQPARDELSHKHRLLAVTIEEQISDLSRRMDPWSMQSTHERKQVKRQLSEVLEDRPARVEQLLGVANESKRPWLQLYLAKTKRMHAVAGGQLSRE